MVVSELIEKLKQLSQTAEVVYVDTTWGSQGIEDVEELAEYDTVVIS